MKGSEILDLVEKVCNWSLVGLLCFVGLGSMPINPTSVVDYGSSLYYFTIAVIVCPKTPLHINKKLVFGMVAFLYGIWMGLI
ncbi:hypothetical protein CEN40_22135 [Fischerella thermalis CCMEE 5205]|nr:hypothetical protein CEN40_22135 [Fischerella thermalis CCMEE 5205]